MAVDFDEEYYLSVNPDVVIALRSGVIASGFEHYIRFGREEGRLGTPPEGTVLRSRSEHRAKATRYVRGKGIEIGAANAALPVTAECRTLYCDRLTPEEMRAIDPQLASQDLTRVDVQLDLDTEGLRAFESESQDYVIFLNGIQQVANPVACLEEMFRITRPGGHVLVSIPDKRFSVEASRPLTKWEHLLEEYLHKVTAVSDAHYIEMLVVYAPKVLYEGVSSIEPRLREFRRRREHAHVWDTGTFKDFCKRAMRVCDVDASVVEEAPGDDTLGEYLLVFEKRAQLLA